MNALAWETCFKRKAGRDRSRAVTADDVARARETLIVRRVTHLDQLADKLQGERVREYVVECKVVREIVPAAARRIAAGRLRPAPRSRTRPLRRQRDVAGRGGAAGSAGLRHWQAVACGVNFGVILE